MTRPLIFTLLERSPPLSPRGQRMTPDEVADEIKAAMRTLKHMPRDRLRRLKAARPEVLFDKHEAYGRHAARLNKLPPTPEDISRMDHVLFVWFAKPAADERVLLGARGTGMSWRRIMRLRRKLTSRSHMGRRRKWRATIAKIAAHENQ